MKRLKRRQGLMVVAGVSWLGIAIVSAAPYVNEAARFEVSAPDGWQLVEHPQDHHTVSFLAPVDPSVVGVANIRIQWAEAEGKQAITAEDKAEMRQAIQQNVAQATILSERDRTVAGLPAYEFVTRFQQNELWLQLKQVVVMDRDLVFAIAYGGTEQQYASFLSAFDQCVNSFHRVAGSPTPVSEPTP